MTEQEIQLKAAPSKEAVVRYLMGDPNAKSALIKSFFERSILIGAGMLVLGKKGSLIQNSLAASFAIELYLLLYYRKQLRNGSRN